MNNEFLIPGRYTGEEYGIAVMICGLDEQQYDVLEVSCDGEHYFPLKQEGTQTEVYQFENLLPDMYYTIYGRAVAGDYVREITAVIGSAKKLDERDHADVSYMRGGALGRVVERKVFGI